MMIEMQHLDKSYWADKTEVPVLHDICLTVEEGEYVSIMGPSGSGKSTLMNIIGCLDVPSAGTYALNGEVISEKSDLYQSLKRHEKPFGDAIVGMVKALAFLVGKTAEDITVKFDDSIIEDAAATLDRQIKMVNNGLQSKLRALMAVHGITEDEAKKRLEEIMSADAIEKAMFGGLG